MIQLLQSEGVKLNEAPVKPVDTKLHSSSYQADEDTEEMEWAEYLEWIKVLNETATNAFIRGIGEINDTMLISLKFLPT